MSRQLPDAVRRRRRARRRPRVLGAALRAPPRSDSGNRPRSRSGGQARASPRRRRCSVSSRCSLALAAAQPVVSRSEATHGRDGAEVLVVFDVTRSMLARRAPPSRPGSTAPARSRSACGPRSPNASRRRLAHRSRAAASVPDARLELVRRRRRPCDRRSSGRRPTGAPATRRRSPRSATSAARRSSGARRPGGSPSSSATARRCPVDLEMLRERLGQGRVVDGLRARLARRRGRLRARTARATPPIAPTAPVA